MDEDSTLPESMVTDSSLNPLYPAQIQQIKKQYENNTEFRSCIDLKLGKDDLETLKNMEELTENNIKVITKVLKKFSELSPSNIYACMENLDNFEPSEICNGLLIQEYLQLVEIIILYFDSQITIDTSDPELLQNLIDETIPYMKTIFKNLIDYSKAYPSCKNKDMSRLDIYIKMHDRLFPQTKLTNYTPFKNTNIGTNFFNEFLETFYGKIILLVFIAYIFTQIINLFKNPSVEVPAK